jgi:hypothetical protein
MPTSEEISAREQGAQTETGKIDICGGWKINAEESDSDLKNQNRTASTENKSQILINKKQSNFL